jgi:hypothetical protein
MSNLTAARERLHATFKLKQMPDLKTGKIRWMPRWQRAIRQHSRKNTSDSFAFRERQFGMAV